MDVGASCSHKHTNCQAGVHILQVHLGGMRSEKKDYNEQGWTKDTLVIEDKVRGGHSNLLYAYVHLGEFEESVKVDVAVKHVHDGTRDRGLKRFFVEQCLL